MNDGSMADEQRQLARDLGALADRLTSGEPLFGPEAKEGDEVEGRAEGRVEGRAEMARHILRSRGIEVSEGFPAGLPGFHESSEEVVAAALACESEADFLTRLRRPGRAR